MEGENGEWDGRLDLQGGWFGEVGQWDVHIIKESNRNCGERNGFEWTAGQESEKHTSNPVLV